LLVLTPDFPPAFGGIQLLVSRVTEHLTRLDPLVVAFDAPGAASFDRSRATPVKRIRRPSVAKTSNLFLNAAALREARRFRPDLTLSAHVVAAPAASVLASVGGVPFVQYLHGNEVAERPRLSRLAVARAAATVAVSAYTGELAMQAGVDPARLHRIPPGVDLPSTVGGRRSTTPTVVTISRLADRRKGHDVMIRALSQIRASVPDVSWVVIGDGPLREELEELARAEGVADSIRFTGGLPDDDRDAWLDRAHVFAMPSRLPPSGRGGEGFGIVYLEAAAHGLPAVAGNVGGVADAVIDGETGLLVDPTSPDAVAGAVVELLRDHMRAEALGRAGAARAQQFAWPTVVRRVEELLLATVHARRR
jgi:phosphatidylinositol alpha-1,6-mannosyltransferase